MAFVIEEYLPKHIFFNVSSGSRIHQNSKQSQRND